MSTLNRSVAKIVFCLILYQIILSLNGPLKKHFKIILEKNTFVTSNLVYFP